MVHLGRWEVEGVSILLQWYCLGKNFGPKYRDQYRRVIDLGTWSVKEVIFIYKLHSHQSVLGLMENNSWRALFQNVLRANPKIAVAMPMPSLEINFWKRTLHRYVHICIYNIHAWKALYQSTIFELGIGIASSFSGMVLNAFLERKKALQL